MRKKRIKTKGVKIELPERSAVYPLRCGLEVFAIDWDSHAFIKGLIIATYAMSELNEPGATYFYDVELGTGEVFNAINEEDIFLTAKEMREFIMVSFECCDSIE